MSRFHPRAFVFIGTQHSLGEVELSVSEQVELLLVRLHALQNRLSAQPFVCEQRQRRHAERIPLRFPSPSQKR